MLACDDGAVLFAGDAGTAGTMVHLQHNFGTTRYLHLSSLRVRQGDRVAGGATVGLSGNTGLSTGPHLHLDLYLNGEPQDNGYGGRVDPLPYLEGT